MMQETLRNTTQPIAASGNYDVARDQAREIEQLKAELREAHEGLAAIRTGAADALVVVRDGREMIYTLENADKPFRIFLEEMQEGAVTVDPKGLVVYANRRFADLEGAPLESVMGSSFHDLVCPADQAAVQNFLRNEGGHAEKIEVSLRVGRRGGPGGRAAGPRGGGGAPGGGF